jgi:uncharacterized protein (UPF0276 family)
MPSSEHAHLSRTYQKDALAFECAENLSRKLHGRVETVVERADSGMLLDCAHLAMFQRLRGHAPTTALDGFPLDHVVEMHVAGGTERTTDGYAWVEDDHTPGVLADTWTILEHVVPRAPNLRAVVFECERNPIAACLDGFTRIAGVLGA